MSAPSWPESNVFDPAERALREQLSRVWDHFFEPVIIVSLSGGIDEEGLRTVAGGKLDIDAFLRDPDVMRLLDPMAKPMLRIRRFLQGPLFRLIRDSYRVESDVVLARLIKRYENSASLRARIMTAFCQLTAEPDRGALVLLESFEEFELEGHEGGLEGLVGAAKAVEEAGLLTESARTAVDFVRWKLAGLQGDQTLAIGRLEELAQNPSILSECRPRVQEYLAELLAKRNDRDIAERLLRSALSGYESAKMLGHSCRAARALGDLLFQTSVADSALQMYEVSLAAAHQVGSRVGIAQTLLHIARYCLQLGDTATAFREFEDAAREAEGVSAPIIALATAGQAMAVMAMGESGTEQALRIFSTAGNLFQQLGWESGLNDVGDSIAELFARTDQERRLYLVSRVLKDQQKFLVPAATEACRRYQAAERRGLEREEMTRLTIRHALGNYLEHQPTNREVFDTYYEFADNLARLRTGESELLVFFRALQGKVHDVSFRAKLHVTEALRVEEVWLSGERFSEAWPSCNVAMNWRNDADTEALIDLLRGDDPDSALALARSRVKVVRAEDFSLFDIGAALRTFGFIKFLNGDLEEAEDSLQQGALAFLGASDVPGEMQCLFLIRQIAEESGETEKAEKIKSLIDTLAQNFSVPAYALS